MSVALALILLGFLLVWAGFKGTHPLAEFRAALGIGR